MAEVSDIVRVSATIRPRGTVRREHGRTLFLTSGSGLPASGSDGRVAPFARLADVQEAFPGNDAVTNAAEKYFAQTPHPKNFLVGRWRKAAVPWVLRSGVLSSADIAAISGDSRTNAVDVDVAFSGAANKHLTAINLSSVASGSALAGKLQTALQGVRAAPFTAAAVTVDFANSRLEIRMTTAPGVPPYFIDKTNNYPLATALKLTQAAGAEYHPGGAKQTISDALDELRDADDSWYFLVLESAEADSTNQLEASAWAQTNEVMLVADSHAAAGPAGNAGALQTLSQTARSRTAVIWSAHEDYKAVSLAARLSSVDFDGRATLITAKFRTLPGCKADVLTPTQRDTLDKRRCNYYTAFGGTNVVAEGVTLDGSTWIDAQYWLDWIVGRIRSTVFDLLRQSGRVPLTPTGLALLRDAVSGVCHDGVRNGGIAGGTVSTAMRGEIASAVGDPSFDGNLPSGYLVYVPPLRLLSTSDRDARTAPGFRVWLKGSGAVHFADIDLTFED